MKKLITLLLTTCTFVLSLPEVNTRFYVTDSKDTYVTNKVRITAATLEELSAIQFRKEGDFLKIYSGPQYDNKYICSLRLYKSKTSDDDQICNAFHAGMGAWGGIWAGGTVGGLPGAILGGSVGAILDMALWRHIQDRSIDYPTMVGAGIGGGLAAVSGPFGPLLASVGSVLGGATHQRLSSKY